MNLNELEQLRKNMVEAKKLFDDAANKYAIDNCGHKWGDTVVVTGYSHKGKNMVIDSVSMTVSLWGKEYTAIVSGKVLRADGSLGLNEAKNEIILGIAE